MAASEGRAIGQSLGVGIEDFDSGFLEIVKFPGSTLPLPTPKSRLQCQG